MSPAWPTGLLLGGRPFEPSTSTVTVIGAGTMGPGIAQVFAEAGFSVDLCDLKEDVVRRAARSVADSLSLKVAEGLTDSDLAARALDRICAHSRITEALGRAHLVIEAVTEDRAIKRLVFEQIEHHAPESACVWSNTSTLDVFALAPDSVRPRLLVAHWFAPAEILPLVEVVASPEEAAGACEQSCVILRALGKAPVTLKKYVPGFIVNRLQRALGHEIFHLLDEGVVDPEQLDLAVRTSLAPRMQVVGVVQRYDFTGLALSLRNLRDPDFVDPPIDKSPRMLVDRVERGALGVSTGEGMYDYRGKTKGDLVRERDTLLWRAVARLGDLVTDPRPVGHAIDRRGD